MSEPVEQEEVILTPEDVESPDGFGHTEWEQPTRDNDLNRTTVGGLEVKHRWIQYGNEAICDGAGHNKHATILHPMEMIVLNENGDYEIKPVPILS